MSKINKSGKLANLAKRSIVETWHMDHKAEAKYKNDFPNFVLIIIQRW